MVIYFSECLSATENQNLRFYQKLQKILTLSEFLAQWALCCWQCLFKYVNDGGTMRIEFNYLTICE